MKIIYFLPPDKFRISINFILIRFSYFKLTYISFRFSDKKKTYVRLRPWLLATKFYTTRQFWRRNGNGKINKQTKSKNGFRSFFSLPLLAIDSRNRRMRAHPIDLPPFWRESGEGQLNGNPPCHWLEWMHVCIVHLLLLLLVWWKHMANLKCQQLFFFCLFNGHSFV